MTAGCIIETVDAWIAEKDLPVRPGMKVVKTTDPDYGLTEDEIQDRYEFIRCYLLSGLGSLIMVPKPEPEEDFFMHDCDVTDAAYSAFNTHDFQRSQRPFDKYAYAMRMILKRVKDLAILHSSLSPSDARERVYQRFETLFDHEFRERLIDLVSRHKHCKSEYMMASSSRE